MFTFRVLTLSWYKEMTARRRKMITTKTKILAVGGDPALLELLERGLSDDYQVSCTQATRTSLREVLYRELPDFIILDIMMPNLDGIETCLQLRQWTQVPTMMLSTWGAGDGKVRGLNLGAEGYLTSPFGVNELKKRIIETLKRNDVAVADKLKNIHTSIP
jgi:DNA-binding response OmpR family regulator